MINKYESVNSGQSLNTDFNVNSLIPIDPDAWDKLSDDQIVLICISIGISLLPSILELDENVINLILGVVIN